MDPSPLKSQSVIPEMRQFPMIGVASAVRAPAAGMSRLDASAGESTVTEQSGGNRSRKKRWNSRPLAAVTDAVSEEDSSKYVSTSRGGVDLLLLFMFIMLALSLLIFNSGSQKKLYRLTAGITAL